MAKSMDFEDLARAAAHGVAIALNAHGRAAGGEAGAASLVIPQKLIFGGPRREELYTVSFTQQAGNVQVGQVSRAEL